MGGFFDWLLGRKPLPRQPPRQQFEPLPFELDTPPPQSDGVARVGIGDRKVNLVPHAKRAIRLFGGVRRDKALWLAQMVAAHFNEGRIAQQIAKDGTPFDDAERIALGLPKWPRVSHETFDALTEDARCEPIERLDILVGRIAAWAYDDVRRRDDAGAADLGWSNVMEAPADCCPEAAALCDRKFKPGQTPALPLYTCRVVDCQCRWKLDRPRRR